MSQALPDYQFEGVQTTWLRWADARGHLILTGRERAAGLAARLRGLEENPDNI